MTDPTTRNDTQHLRRELDDACDRVAAHFERRADEFARRIRNLIAIDWCLRAALIIALT